MAIPNKPLELDIVAEALTLKEMVIFDIDEWRGNAGTANKLRLFLIKHSSSWTEEEIDNITVGELESVAASIGKTINEAAVPK